MADYQQPRHRPAAARQGRRSVLICGTRKQQRRSAAASAQATTQMPSRAVQHRERHPPSRCLQRRMRLITSEMQRPLVRRLKGEPNMWLHPVPACCGDCTFNVHQLENPLLLRAAPISASCISRTVVRHHSALNRGPPCLSGRARPSSHVCTVCDCRKARLFVVPSGQGSPCLDLRRVSDTLAEATVGTDLVIIEGMGRAIHTNLRCTRPRRHASHSTGAVVAARGHPGRCDNCRVHEQMAVDASHGLQRLTCIRFLQSRHSQHCSRPAAGQCM